MSDWNEVGWEGIEIVSLRKSGRSFWDNSSLIGWRGACICLVFFAYLGLHINSTRWLLPSAATDVHEFCDSGGFSSDYVYLLKATIPKDSLDAFAARMGLMSAAVQEGGRTDYPWEGWSGMAPDWWRPPRGPKVVFVPINRNDNTTRIMQYDGNAVFYAESFGYGLFVR